MIENEDYRGVARNVVETDYFDAAKVNAQGELENSNDSASEHLVSEARA